MAKKSNVAADKDVLVYCKLPGGMSFPTPHGLVTLKGANDALLVGGFGRTAVPRAAWEYIMSVYRSMKAFAADNPVIFAADRAERGDAEAADKAGAVTGMEPKAPGDIVRRAEAQAGNQQPGGED